jgi:hypothetical protein
MHSTSLLLQKTLLGRQILRILEGVNSGMTHPADLSLPSDRATSWEQSDRTEHRSFAGVWEKILAQLSPTSEAEEGGGPFPEAEMQLKNPTFSKSYPWPTTSMEAGYTRHLVLCLYEESGEAFKLLLWQLLFKGITVTEFMVLDELLKRRWGNMANDTKMVIAFLIFLSLSTRKGLNDLNSKTRPVFNRLPPKFLQRFKSRNPLDDVSAFLGLPRKGRSVSLSHEFRTRRNRKSRAVSRMGIGYKDKGSMGEPGRLSPDLVLDPPMSPAGGRFERDFLSVLRQAKSEWTEPV